MMLLQNRRARNALRPAPPEVVHGFYMADGRLTPITNKSLGASGAQIEALASSTRELHADDIGLALASVSNPIAYRCIELRAQKVEDMPRLLRNKETKEAVTEHPLLDAFAYARRHWKKPILYSWEHSLCVHGETYFEKVSDTFGMPYTLRWLNPTVTEPYEWNGDILYFEYRPQNAQYNVELPPRKVVYDYYHNVLDDLRGLSPLQVALGAVNVDNGAQDYYRSFFKNKGQLGGILSARQGTNIQKADEQRLTTWWREQVEGAKKAFKTIFMPFALEYQNTHADPAPQHTEIERAQTRRICDAFGVPVQLVDFDEERFQLSEEPEKLLYENTIFPECKRITDLMNDDILPFFDTSGTLEFTFDYDAVRALIDNQVKRTTATNAQLMAGNLTINEARTAMGRPEIDGADVLFIPRAVQIVKQDELGALVDRQQAQAETALQASAAQAEAQAHPPTAPPDQVTRPAQDTSGADQNPNRELKAWQTVAEKSLSRARAFQAYALPESIAQQLRGQLTVLADDASKADVKSLFTGARAALRDLLETQDADALTARFAELNLEEVLHAA